MGVTNGQDANEVTFNTAFMARDQDTSTVGKVDLKNSDTVSGPEVDNIQRELNGVASFTGRTPNGAKDEKPSWSSTDAGTTTDDLKDRAEALTEKFNLALGHAHSGAAGDGAPVDATTLSNVRLKGSFVFAAPLSAITGSSTVVTTQMAGKTPSSTSATKGVVVSSSNNVVVLKDNTTATRGDFLRDSHGNLVYGRLTYAATVWTLSFFVMIGATETAYSFTAQEIQWFYQELFNPLTDAPVYSELASIPSDNVTQDVLDASTTERGAVSTGTQSFAGNKTFTGTVGASNLSGTNTGDQTITLTGDVTGSGTGSFAATIAANAVTNAKAAQMANATFKGRTTAGTGNPEDLTAAQATALLNAFVGDSGSGGTKGQVPAPASGDAAAGKVLGAGGAWVTQSGGGGGGSLQWVEDVNAPTPQVENSDRVYLFTPGGGQALYARIKVPSSYLTGSPIKLRAAFYSPDSSGNALVQAVATLLRTGTDAVSSTTNQRTTTNTAVTLGGGTVNKLQALTLDLTDSTGHINSVAVSAGDFILIALQLGTTTATSDVRVPVYASEITFT